MNEIFVGIDFGNKNLRACYLRNGRPNLIRFSGISKMLPSVLYVDAEEGIMIGKDAKNRGFIDPNNVINFSINDIGKNKTWTAGGKTFTPAEVATEILKEVKKQIVKKFRCDIINAVITVPANFTSEQTRKAQNAAKIAGFNDVQIIAAPVAVAVAARKLERYKKIFVVDFGNSFEISVLQFDAENNSYSVLDSYSDKDLGGENFNELLYNYFMEIIQDDLGIESFSQEKNFISDNLKQEIEYFKTLLSEEETVVISIYIGICIDIKKILSYELTREDFENICAPVFEKISSAVKNFIEGSEKFKADEIVQIIFDGGSCNIPKVRAVIEKFFNPRAGFYNPRADFYFDTENLAVYGAYYSAQKFYGERQELNQKITDLEEQLNEQKASYEKQISKLQDEIYILQSRIHRNSN